MVEKEDEDGKENNDYMEKFNNKRENNFYQ